MRTRRAAEQRLYRIRDDATRGERYPYLLADDHHELEVLAVGLDEHRSRCRGVEVGVGAGFTRSRFRLVSAETREAGGRGNRARGDDPVLSAVQAVLPRPRAPQRFASPSPSYLVRRPCGTPATTGSRVGTRRALLSSRAPRRRWCAPRRSTSAGGADAHQVVHARRLPADRHARQPDAGQADDARVRPGEPRPRISPAVRERDVLPSGRHGRGPRRPQGARLSEPDPRRARGCHRDLLLRCPRGQAGGRGHRPRAARRSERQRGSRATAKTTTSPAKSKPTDAATAPAAHPVLPSGAAGRSSARSGQIRAAGRPSAVAGRVRPASRLFPRALELLLGRWAVNARAVIATPGRRIEANRAPPEGRNRAGDAESGPRAWIRRQ